MNAYLYLEGGASGANSKELSIRCQQAFHTLLDQMGFKGRKPRLVACGGRSAVYDRFCTALKLGGNGYVALWIDSEEPMLNTEDAWKHLKQVTTVPPWDKPTGAEDEQVLFMTTCMETWIVADRAALRKHFKHELNENPLPALLNLESRSRGDVQDALERATQNCRNAYAKGKRSFDALEKLDPAVLKQHLTSFARVDRILKAKL